MDDHPHSSFAAGETGNNGWQAGQMVALASANLAGLRGLLVRHHGHHRWVVSVNCRQRGVFLVVPAGVLVLLQQAATETLPRAEFTLPPLKPESPRGNQE